MSATVSEQLREFHITGHGLDDAVPKLSSIAVAAGRTLPAEEAAYPIRLAPGCIVPFHADAAIVLPANAILQARGPIRAQFIERLRQTAERLEDLLALDDSHAEDAVSPAAITNSLGAGAGRYLNAASLAGALRRRTSPVHRMAPERRNRCTGALRTLRQALTAIANQPPFHLFHIDPAPNPFDGELHQAADPCAAALAFARNQLSAAEPALRALRIARLDLDGAYDPGLHEPILQRFRWEAALPSELAAQPPVIAALTAAQAAACPLNSWSQLLRSGCPIQIIVTQPSLSAGDLQSSPLDLAQLAIAHRDAFVLQGSLAYPDHLLPALAALAQSPRPALAVIATPSDGGWPEAVILPLAKAWALYTYNPAPRANWRDCFQLHPIEPNSWTPAHAAALNPALKNQFRLLPETADEHDPIELDRYLERFHDRAPLAVPFFTTGDNVRVAVSRDLAEYCHDRLQAWNLLEQWTAAPPAPKTSSPLTSEDKDQAMRQGAQLAVARAIALLTGVQP